MSGKRKVDIRGIAFLNNPPHSYWRDTYRTNRVAKLPKNNWIDNDI